MAQFLNQYTHTYKNFFMADNMQNTEQPLDEQQNENDISPLEKTLLDNASDEFDEDDANLMRAQLDDTDADGTPLNEGGGAGTLTAADLDVPGAMLDDADEAIGSEDEENNDYSEADTK